MEKIEEKLNIEENYLLKEMQLDILCYTCHSEIPAGETVYIHKAKSSVHCENCTLKQ